MKQIILGALLAFGSVLTAGTPTKAALFPEQNGGMTKNILQTKSGLTMFYRSDDEAAVLDWQTVPKSGARSSLLGYRLVKGSAAELAKKFSGSADYHRVFYTSKVKNERNRYIETGNMLVKLAPRTSVEDFVSSHQLKLLKVVDGRIGLYLIAPDSRGDIIARCNSLNALPEVESAGPEWIRPVLLR